MVRPGHRTHHPLPARAILPRDPACRTAQPEVTRGRYERGLVSQTPPHLQRHTRRGAATFLAGTGFCHVLPSRRGEKTPLSTPGRHYLCALPRRLMAKVEIIPCECSPPDGGLWPTFAPTLCAGVPVSADIRPIPGDFGAKIAPLAGLDNYKSCPPPI